jgi:hypothetical protein
MMAGNGGRPARDHLRRPAIGLRHPALAAGGAGDDDAMVVVT